MFIEKTTKGPSGLFFCLNTNKTPNDRITI